MIVNHRRRAPARKLYQIEEGWLSRVPYRPHERQAPFHLQPHPARFLWCSRRFGKDAATEQEVSRLLQEWADPIRYPKPEFIIPRIHGWFLSPTYKLSREWERNFRAIWPGDFEYSKTERTYTIPSLTGEPDMLIEFQTAEEPDRLVGSGLDFLAATEMHLFEPAVWEQVLPSLVSPYRYGLLMGTAVPWPNPKMEELKSLADAGADDIWYYTGASHENPHIDRKKLATEISRCPEFLKGPLYLGKWPKATGTIFRHIDRTCSIPDPFETADGPVFLNSWTRGVTYEGLDPARLHDFMVYVAFEWRDGRLWQLAYDRFNKQDWKDQYDRINSAAGRYRNRVGRIDATPGSMGDPVEAELRDRGIPFDPVDFGREKPRLVRQLQSFLDHDKLRCFDLPMIKKEFREYQGRLGPTGRISYGAPQGEGFFDDIVSAIMLAIDAVIHSPAPPSDALISELHRMVA